MSALPAGLLERIVARLRGEEPSAIAILLRGSYATGRATALSDLDLTIVTDGPPAVDEYRTFYEPRAGMVPLPVSYGTYSLADHLAHAREPNAWDDWSLGFPTEQASLFLWATEKAVKALGDPPTIRRDGAGPEVEDFVECATKVKRAQGSGDALGARWHAADLGRRAPGVLRPLNPERRVRDRRDALDAALSLEVAPLGYRRDVAVAIGLTSATDDEVARAAMRLARGCLALLREGAPDADPQPGIGEALKSGLLEARLEDYSSAGGSSIGPTAGFPPSRR